MKGMLAQSTMRSMKTSAWIVFSMVCVCAHAATTIQWKEFTWEIAEDRSVVAGNMGTFANGEPWVVGPVTITSITPSYSNIADRVRNGTMINPSGNSGRGGAAGPCPQGWDSLARTDPYDAALNIADNLPYVVAAGSSVLSCESMEARTNNMIMQRVGILTVLAAPAAAGDFRPGYHAGVSKVPAFNRSQIRYDRLNNLAPVAGQPTLATVAERYDRPYIVLGSEYFANYHSAWDNLPYPGDNYGREHNLASGEAALVLNTSASNAQKETAAVGFIQWGLDIYSAVQSGVYWAGNGGHQGGRKLPMLVAGILLDSPEIVAAADGTTHPNRFAEDSQTFYIQQADVEMVRLGASAVGETGCSAYNDQGQCTRPIDAFLVGMIGLAEWGPNHVEDPSHSGSNWGIAYRGTAGDNFPSNALAVHVMGISSQWAHPAFLDYADRYWSVEGGSSGIPTWVKTFWTAHRNATPPSTAPISRRNKPGRKIPFVRAMTP